MEDLVEGEVVNGDSPRHRIDIDRDAQGAIPSSAMRLCGTSILSRRSTCVMYLVPRTAALLFAAAPCKTLRLALILAM
jgi:hypothetical protein